jgi:hypothetical protein
MRWISGEPRWLKSDGPQSVRETLIRVAIYNRFVVADPQPVSAPSTPFLVFLLGRLNWEPGFMPPTAAVTSLAAIGGKFP